MKKASPLSGIQMMIEKIRKPILPGRVEQSATKYKRKPKHPKRDSNG